MELTKTFHSANSGARSVLIECSSGAARPLLQQNRLLIASIPVVGDERGLTQRLRWGDLLEPFRKVGPRITADTVNDLSDELNRPSNKQNFHCATASRCSGQFSPRLALRS